MKASRRFRLLLAGGLAAVVVAIVATLLASNSAGAGPGPLSTLRYHGQPYITASSGPARPGQEYNATAFVTSTARGPVTLISAVLVPLSGQPAGRFRHAGVYLTHSYDAGHATYAWPPRGDHVRPLAGARIGPGQTDILYAMTGPVSGYRYTMAGGIKITYRWQGAVYSVTAWSAAVACGDKLSFGRCGDLGTKAQDLTTRQAG
jgi:hypothetical protein